MIPDSYSNFATNNNVRNAFVKTIIVTIAAVFITSLIVLFTQRDPPYKKTSIKPSCEPSRYFPPPSNAPLQRPISILSPSISSVKPSGNPSASLSYVSSTTTSSIPDIVVEKFIEDFGLVENATLTFQQISSQNTFVYNKKIFHLDEALPFTLSSPDAIYSHNGVSSNNFPRPNIVKLEDDEDIVTIRKHADGEVKMIFIVNKDTGMASEIQNIHPGILATIQTGDYAEVPFILAEDETDFTRTEKRPKMTRANSEDFSDQNEECSRYSVLELAVAYESSFCAYYGRNATRADEEVVSIVSLVSSRYQQRNLCVKVVLSYLEGYCDPDVDPYKEAVDLGESGCSRPGLTTFFRNYWNANNPTIRRGVANLFSGSILECTNIGCVAGCAYKSTTCNRTEAYGVVYATYDDSDILKSTLVAHELGHNHGAQHVEDNQYIMSEFITESHNGFSPYAVEVFNDRFSRTDCVVPEVVTPTSAPSKGSSPVPLLPTSYLKMITFKLSFFVTILILS